MPAPIRTKQVILSLLGITGLVGITGLLTFGRPIAAPSITTTGAATSTVQADLAVLDDLTVKGDVITTSTPRAIVCSFQSTAPSSTAGTVQTTVAQRLCSIQNTGPAARVLLAANARVASSSPMSLNAVAGISISLSPSEGATGTGPGILMYHTFPVSNFATGTLTTTSTLEAYGATSTAGITVAIGPKLWNVGEWLNLVLGTPTSTLAGELYVRYIGI